MSRLALLEHPAHGRCFAVLVVAQLALWGIVVAAPVRPSVGAAALLWAAGLLGWSLLEYLLHRFLFHVPRASWLAWLGARQHAFHHDDPTRLPITKPLAVTLGAFGLGFAAAARALGAATVAPAWAGLLAGYLVYELSHVACHRGDPERHPAPRFRAHHLRHHEEPGRCFGISTPLWDHVLGTGPSARR